MDSYLSRRAAQQARMAAFGRQRGFIVNPYVFAASGGGSDPYYSDSVLILNGDGSNGGTTITDSSSYAHTPSTNNNVTTQTSVVKFGTASLSFNGTDSYLEYTAASEFQIGTGDFTIEAWVYPTSISGTRVFYDSRTVGSDANGMAIYMFGGIQIYQANANQLTVVNNFTVNNWQHMAITREGTNVRAWLNGAYQSTWSTSQNFSNNVCGLGRDRVSNNQFFAGYMEFRFTKGVARYTGTGSITVPSAAFPTS